MITYHLCYYELPKNVQDYLKEEIFNIWLFQLKDDKETRDPKFMREEIDKMFEINNAGIDIAIYPYMYHS